MTAIASRQVTTDTQPVARAVAMSTAAQLVARGFDVLVNITVSLAILRHLGPSDYGDFVVVVTVTGLVGLVAELGLPKLSVREVARDDEAADSIIGTVMAMRVVLALAATCIAQLVLFALGADAEVRLATLIASTMFVAEALLSVVVVFHVKLRQQYEAGARLAANVVKLVVVLVLVATGAGLIALVAATTVTLLVASAVAWAIAWRRFELRPKVDRRRIAPLLRATLPVWPAMLAGVLYLKLDALLVALLGTSHDVGIYGAAYQPVEYVLLGTAVILHVLFPLVAKAHGRDAEMFTKVYRRGTEILLVAVLPVAVALLLVAGSLTTFAYESRFEGAGAPMAVLGVALVFLSLNAWQGLVLLAADRQKINLVYLVIAIVVNVLLDLALIPWLGPVGAAWGTLISGVVVVACSTYAVARLAGASLSVAGIGRVVAAATGFFVVSGGLLLVGIHALPALCAGALTYPVLLVLLGAFRIDDLRALKKGAPPEARIDIAGGIA